MQDTTINSIVDKLRATIPLEHIFYDDDNCGLNNKYANYGYIVKRPTQGRTFRNTIKFDGCEYLSTVGQYKLVLDLDQKVKNVLKIVGSKLRDCGQVTLRDFDDDSHGIAKEEGHSEYECKGRLYVLDFDVTTTDECNCGPLECLDFE